MEKAQIILDGDHSWKRAILWCYVTEKKQRKRELTHCRRNILFILQWNVYAVFTQTLDYIFQWTFNSAWYMVCTHKDPLHSSLYMLPTWFLTQFKDAGNEKCILQVRVHVHTFIIHHFITYQVCPRILWISRTFIFKGWFCLWDIPTWPQGWKESFSECKWGRLPALTELIS